MAQPRRALARYLLGCGLRQCISTEEAKNVALTAALLLAAVPIFLRPGLFCRPSWHVVRLAGWVVPWRGLLGIQCSTIRFGSTGKVLAKCMLKYYRISECSGRSEDHSIQIEV